MLAVIAAVLFGIALLLQLAGNEFGPVLEVATLTTAGLLCVALHLAGVGTTWRGRWGRRR
ncbi:MAG: hypothetical protein ACRDUA_14120 [Micromonosporaceae bacterium]